MLLNCLIFNVFKRIHLNFEIPFSIPQAHQRSIKERKSTLLFLTKGRTSSWVITRYRRMVRIPGKRESLLIFENCATVEREKSLPRKKRDVSPCGKRKKKKKNKAILRSRHGRSMDERTKRK